MAEQFESTKVHVEIIEKLDDNSSPQEVLNQLNAFAEQFNLDGKDELWMVIDRDFKSWTPAMIKSVAQICHQKKGFHLALSNPAFELWLILHFQDCTVLPLNVQSDLLINDKVSSNKTYSKRMLTNMIGGFNEAKYDASKFMPHVETAINNAIKLDVSPKTRWPAQLGTRVYRLVQSIIASGR